MEWTWATSLLATTIVAAGALLQAATGLGAGLIIVPLLALLSVELVPGPTIFASLALSVLMMARGRRHIDFTSMPPVIAGLLLGTVAASIYIAHLPIDALGIVFGAFILGAIAISLRAPRFSLERKGYVAAGVISGVMGTSAGVGAPILALVFQHYPGERLRATLALLYALSSVMMLAFLHLADRFGANELTSGLILMPGFLIGYFGSAKLAAMIDGGYARPAVLVISATSACLLIWRSVALLM